MPKIKKTLKEWCEENDRMDLLGEWKSDINPDTISRGSDYKATWECPICGGQYVASVNKRTGENTGCPYCKNKKLFKGHNDLRTVLPNVANEWHPTKNRDIMPDDVIYCTNKKFWFKCAVCNYEWKTSLSNRASGRNCPECGKIKCRTSLKNNRKEKKEDLESLCIANGETELLNEWHHTKNEPLKPSDVGYSSNKKVWWKCKFGHEWQTSINNRTTLSKLQKNKCGCPYCGNKRIKIGFNDLETWSKENGLDYIIDEWNDSKEITSFTNGSDYKAKWKCRFCGHEWCAQISNRTNLSAGRTGCPKCNNKTSFAEQTILYYAQQYFPMVVNRYLDLGFELDIYIPSIKTAIEYDGLNYHKHKPEMEKDKNQKC